MHRCLPGFALPAWLLLCAMFGLVPATLGSPRHSAALDDATLARDIDRYLKQLGEFGFSGTVLIAKDGRVLLSEGYGCADRATSRAMTANDALYLGSISKQFTATAVLLCERDGLLRTDDPIDLHLADVPPDKREVTIHHLLTHTSGLLRDVPGDVHEPLTVEAGLDRILKAPLLHRPGTQFEYSNAAYCMLATIVAKVTAVPFPEFVHDSIFLPAHMEHTCFLGEEPLREQLLATCYTRDDGAPHSPREWPATFKRLGPGGIVSTTADLSRWDMALQGEQILSAAEKEKLFKPFKGNYAYGWSIDRTADGHRNVNHNGGFIGISTTFNRYVDDHLTLIMLCNQEGLAPIVTRTLEAWWFGQRPPPLPRTTRELPPELATRQGSYALPSGGRFRVEIAGDVTVTPEDGDAVGVFLLAAFQRPAAAEAAAVAARTEQLVSGFARGDFAPWQSLASASLRSALTTDALASEWRQLLDSQGAFARVEILGISTVENTERLRAHVRTVASRSPFYESYLWEQDHVVAITNDAPPPTAYRFLPVAEPIQPTLAWHDVYQGTTVTMRFTDGATGTDLHLAMRSGEIVCKRSEDRRR